MSRGHPNEFHKRPIFKNKARQLKCHVNGLRMVMQMARISLKGQFFKCVKIRTGQVIMSMSSKCHVNGTPTPTY